MLSVSVWGACCAHTGGTPQAPGVNSVGMQGAHCGYAAGVQLTEVICNSSEVTARHDA